jgi:hypothetical protein
VPRRALHVADTHRENVHKLAKDGYLFVTWANHHYTDFVMSWVARLRALGLTNYLVGAMDNDILSTLARRSVHTFSMQSGEARQQGSVCVCVDVC